MRGIITTILLSLTVFLCVAVVYHDGIAAIKANAQKMHVSMPDDIQKEFSK